MTKRSLAILVLVACLIGCRNEERAAPMKYKPAPDESTAKPKDDRMHFEHSEFVLDLDPTWTRLDGDDREAFQFESKPLATMLTISVIVADIPKAKMTSTAEKFLEIRHEAELIDSTRKVTFGDQWVKPDPNGEIVEISYAGYDTRGRIFRFTGFVTSHKIVSFYCETPTDDNERAKNIFKEAFGGFRFYVP